MAAAPTSALTPAGKPPIVAPITGAQPGTWQPFSYHGMEYYILLPHNYDVTYSYPLMLYLHQDRAETREPAQIDPWFNSSTFRTRYPCILLLPICAINGHPSSATLNWGGTSAPSQPLMCAITLLQQTISRYSVNLNKIYVTGAAMGGTGTWAILANPFYRKFFAAAMPLGGSYYDMANVTTLAKSLKTFPIWSVHGSADTAVSPAFDTAFHKASMAIGGIARYSPLVMGQNVWTKVYPAYAPYMDWLFMQKGSSVVLPSALPDFVSPDGAEVSTLGPALIDSIGRRWTLVQSSGSGIQIAVNGNADPTTANVVKIIFHAQRIYQTNQAGGWWYETISNTTWVACPAPMLTASTVPPEPFLTAVSPTHTAATVSAHLDQLHIVLQAVAAGHPSPLITHAMGLLPGIKAAVSTLSL